MQSKDPYEANNRSRIVSNSRGPTQEDLVRQNERLRYGQVRHEAELRNGQLARENERLRDEQAYRNNAGAVGSLVLGVLIFALAALGLGAFYYLGRDTGASQTVPTPPPAQPQGQIQTPDVNVNVPQPPPINVEAPEPQPIRIEVPAPETEAQVAPEAPAPAAETASPEGTEAPTTHAPVSGNGP